MKRIIVDGATSMLGVALIEWAVAQQAEVYALVRAGTARIGRLPRSELVHPVCYELAALKELKAQIPSDCEAFYHLAWTGTGKAERDDPKVQMQNIGYTLDAVELAGALHCSKFVFAGSQAEYGPCTGIISAQNKVRPTLSYGIAKYSAGALSRKLCERLGLYHLWCRIFSVYGRHDNPHTMLDEAITGFLRGQRVQFSSGSQLWNYLHEKDAGRYLWQLTDRLEGDLLCNLASTESLPLRDYILKLADVMGARELCQFAPQGAAPLQGLQPDSAELEALGLYPQISFEEGISEMVEYYQSSLAT